MATRVDELGNGTGLVYITDLSSNILVTMPNNTVSVSSIRTGAVTPVAAQKSAVSTLTVTSASGAGAISAITISGINQISGSISIGTTNTTTLAGLIVAAINAYTPSGTKRFASNVGAVVSIIDPEALGSTDNGVLPTITSTGSSTFTITAFAGGSSNTGITDSVFGQKYYLNSDSAADPSDLTGSIEVTKYLANRGLQTGLLTQSITIASDGISGITRAGFKTVIVVDTEASAATDVLAFIDTTGMVEGDEVVIRGANTARVVSVESSPTTGSSAVVKNIYLASNVTFTTGAYNSLTLQYRYDTTLGGILTEIGRTTAGSSTYDLEISRAAALALISGAGITKGQRYLIYNVGDGIGLSSGNNIGIILTGETTNKFSIEGVFLARVVDRTAVPNMYDNSTIYAINAKVENFNEVYVSNVGANTGNLPASSAAYWTFSPKTTANYTTEVQGCIYDIVNDIIKERWDARGNHLTNLTTVASANELILQCFRWGTDNVYGNTIKYKQTSVGWSPYRLPYNNEQLLLSTIPSVVADNTMDLIGGWFIDSAFVGSGQGNIINNIIDTSPISIDPTPTGLFFAIQYNRITACQISVNDGFFLEQSTVFGPTLIAANTNFSISYFYGAMSSINNTDVTIQNCWGNGVAYISSNQNTSISNSNIDGNSQIDSCTNMTFNVISMNGESYFGVINNTSGVSVTIDHATLTNGEFSSIAIQTSFPISYMILENATITNCIFNNTQGFGGIGSNGISALSNINVVGKTIDGNNANPFIFYPVAGINDNQTVAPTYTYGFDIEGEFSTATTAINCAAASSFASNTLIIQSNQNHVGTFLLYNTTGQVINRITGLYPAGTDILQKTFRVVSGTGVYFSPTAVASATASRFVYSSTSAINLTRTSDFITMKQVGSYITIIESVKIV